MTLHLRGGAAAALLCGLLMYAALPSAASAMEAADTSVASTTVAGTSVLEAADHAELSAWISASGVVRIALLGDRIARAVRSVGRFAIEHDPANGDLYIRPPDVARGGTVRAAEPAVALQAMPAVKPEAEAAVEPAVLFVGTEKGFTYRLVLTPVAGGPAQVLIRNPAATAGAAAVRQPAAGNRRIGALVRLVRAVAQREPLAGYAIHAGGAVAGAGVVGTRVSGTSVSGTSVSGLTVIETWRGTGAFPRPRFSALVFEAGHSASEGADGAAGLARTLVPETIGGLSGMGRLAALWLAAPGTGPSGGRLAVAVHEDTRAADTRAADPRGGDPR